MTMTGPMDNCAQWSTTMCMPLYEAKLNIGVTDRGSNKLDNWEAIEDTHNRMQITYCTAQKSHYPVSTR